MKLFVIKTKELRSVEHEWKQITVTTVVAENSYRVLIIVSK